MGGADQASVEALDRWATQVGLAFQIVDDILDVEGEASSLGKTAGKDARADKTTYVKLHGIDASRRLAREHTDAALAALDALPGEGAFLHALVESMAKRSN